MKKFALLATALALCVCFSACGCNRTTAGDPTVSTPATTMPTTGTTMPMPTLETNIPDPTVDSNSTENGGLMGTDNTGMTEGTGPMN